MTLEEAQEQIVELSERISYLETERDLLSSQNSELVGEVEKVRTINQKYFEKLTAQTLPDEEPEPDEPEESLVDFAKTLSI